MKLLSEALADLKKCEESPNYVGIWASKTEEDSVCLAGAWLMKGRPVETVVLETIPTEMFFLRIGMAMTGEESHFHLNMHYNRDRASWLDKLLADLKEADL